MSYLFIYYPKCSTCQRAKKWLDEKRVAYESRHILDDRPTAEDLTCWIQKSGMPIKRFFNTSGMLYREKQLKEKLPSMTEQEQIAVLSTDGMLVKRPLLIGDDFVLTGFRQADWIEKLGFE